jgi:hypothetical protein
MITSSKPIYELTSNTTQSNPLRNRNSYQATYLSPHEHSQLPPQIHMYKPKEQTSMSQPMPNPIRLESPPTDSPGSTPFLTPKTTHPSPTNPKTLTYPLPTRGYKARKKLLLRKKPPTMHISHKEPASRPREQDKEPTPLEEQCGRKSDYNPVIKASKDHPFQRVPMPSTTRPHPHHRLRRLTSRHANVTSRRLNLSLTCPRLSACCLARLCSVCRQPTLSCAVGACGSVGREGRRVGAVREHE